MTPHPDIDSLRLLVLVAERGSLTAAAGELRISQPSASKRLARLERRLGVRLVDRTRRGSSLTPAGTLVMIAPGAGQWVGPLVRIAGALLISRFSDQRLRPFLSSVSMDDLLVLREMVEAGTLRPVIDRTFPYEQIPDAIRYVEAGRARGKTPTHSPTAAARRAQRRPPSPPPP